MKWISNVLKNTIGLFGKSPKWTGSALKNSTRFFVKSLKWAGSASRKLIGWLWILSKGPIRIGRHKIDKSSIVRVIVACLIVVIVAPLAWPYIVSGWRWIVGSMVSLTIIYLFYRYTRNKKIKDLAERYKTDLTVIGLSIFGIVALNLLVHFTTTVQPRIWQWYWGNQYFFWSWNLGWVAVAFLSSKRDDKNKVVPTAATIRSAVITVLFASFVINLFTSTWPGSVNTRETKNSVISKSVVNLSYGVPAEIALRIIAECESCSKQFEVDGVTPLKNKERASSAFGKYQFLESHREPATKLGFDLNTEAGQDGYALHLYNESRTQHWEADSRSVACWEPKLRAYAWGGNNGGEVVSLVVTAPIDSWSDIIPLPRNGERGGQHSLDGFGKKYAVRWNNGRRDEIEEDLPRPEGAIKKKPPVVYDFRLKSREPETVPITVRFF